MLKRKIRFIINKKSGLFKAENLKHKIENYIKKTNIQYDFSICHNIDEINNSCQECLKLTYDTIVAVGGDGTINICARNIIDKKINLGIIPTGSGNGIAYTLGLNSNIEKCINIIINKKTTKIDLGIINNHIFLNNAGFGFDAYIAKKVKNKNNRGLKMYIYSVAKELFNFQEHEYTISTNNKEINITAYIVSIFNANQYGNKLKISSKSIINDGLLELIIIQKPHIIYAPILLFLILINKVEKSRLVKIISGHNFNIKTNSNLFQIDGDYKKYNQEYTIKVKNKSLNILTP